MKYIKSITLIILLLLISCSSDDNETVQNNNEHNLIIKFKFDPNQERLDNFGNLSTIPEGNAAQSPIFERMSANYIEFAPNANTLLGQGEIIYEGLQTNLGGDTAIDFQNASFAGNNETFLTIPLSNVAAGSYSWVRTSLAYQEGNFDILVNGLQYTGTLGSFVGFNNYITTVDINGNSFVINENKLQGFWLFEASGFTSQGQAPEGATTVPNPLFNSSPIPQGSCIVTGEFSSPLNITGNETEDIEVTLSFSVNNSIEWNEVNPDGKYEPEIGEEVVNMGLRGLIPFKSN